MSTDTPPPEFAWCFSHGTLHTSRGWCTAYWMPLEGATKEEALDKKQRLYGFAEFIHHLPDDQQLEVMRARRTH